MDLDRVLAKLEQQEKTLEAILVQTKETNGRVNKHDVWIGQHEAETRQHVATLEAVSALVKANQEYKDQIKGGWIALSILGGIIACIAGLFVAWRSHGG